MRGTLAFVYRNDLSLFLLHRRVGPVNLCVFTDMELKVYRVDVAWSRPYTSLPEAPGRVESRQPNPRGLARGSATVTPPNILILVPTTDSAH